jgi:hypothetical protein
MTAAQLARKNACTCTNLKFAACVKRDGKTVYAKTYGLRAFPLHEAGCPSRHM